MTPEISAALPVSAISNLRSATSGSDNALRLLQPIQSLLGDGESAQAEVVAVDAGDGNDFRLLLQLSLADGSKALVNAQTSQPVYPGSLFTLTALGDARLLSALQSAGPAPLESLDLDAVPLGTQLQAKVLLSQVQPSAAPGQPATYQTVVTLLDTALAGRQLSLQTSAPLAPGSLLTAQVRGAQQIGLLPLAGRLDQLDLQRRLNGELSRQGSMDGLLAALLQLGDDDQLPTALRSASARLLEGLPTPADLADPAKLAKALLSSGSFMESRLAGGQEAGDLKSGLLRLLAQLLPLAPNTTPTGQGYVAQQVAQALPGFLRNALGAAGGPAPRQAGGFPLPTRPPQEQDDDEGLDHLARLALAAIARLQSHQLASLVEPQRQTLPDGTQLQCWQMEIPVRQQQEFIPVQVRLEQESRGEGSGSNRSQQKVWRLELAFDLPPLGPIQVQGQWAQNLLNSQFWAEREGTARLIEAELGYLRQRLDAAGVQVGELSASRGAPPRGPRTVLEQRWVDETA